MKCQIIQYLPNIWTPYLANGWTKIDKRESVSEFEYCTMKQSTPCINKQKRGRPKLELSTKIPSCPCGGESGVSVCKKGIECDVCGQYNISCKASGKCVKLVEKKKHTQQDYQQGKYVM